MAGDPRYPLPGVGPDGGDFFAVPVPAGPSVLIALANPMRKRLLIQNIDAADALFVGASGVTPATGFRLAPGESVAIFTTKRIEAVAAGGAPEARVLNELVTD